MLCSFTAQLRTSFASMIKKPFPLIVTEVVAAIANMDLPLTEFLLHEAGYRENSGLPLLVLLDEGFEYFRKQSDTQFQAIKGTCKMCYKGELGFTFVGKTSGDYFSMLFEVSNGHIIDIALCNNFELSNKSESPPLGDNVDLCKIRSLEVDELLTKLQIATNNDTNDDIF